MVDGLTIFANAHIGKSVIGKRVLLAHPRCPSHLRRLGAPAIKGSCPMDMAVIELSRLQFALTAMYHFLFVPLTLGLSFMLVIMESIYVITKRPIWRVITRFWGKLFGINFVLGVATGLTMEFEFGTNWAYYAHYVGDIFGAPLAIEG
jgi:hypothetical protein